MSTRLQQEYYSLFAALSRQAAVSFLGRRYIQLTRTEQYIRMRKRTSVLNFDRHASPIVTTANCDARYILHSVGISRVRETVVVLICCSCAGFLLGRVLILRRVKRRWASDAKRYQRVRPTRCSVEHTAWPGLPNP